MERFGFAPRDGPSSKNEPNRGENDRDARFLKVGRRVSPVARCPPRSRRARPSSAPTRRRASGPSTSRRARTSGASSAPSPTPAPTSTASARSPAARASTPSSPGQEPGDSTSFQRGCAAGRTRSGEEIHLSRDDRSSKNEPKRTRGKRPRYEPGTVATRLTQVFAAAERGHRDALRLLYVNGVDVWKRTKTGPWTKDMRKRVKEAIKAGDLELHPPKAAGGDGDAAPAPAPAPAKLGRRPSRRDQPARRKTSGLPSALRLGLLVAALVGGAWSAHARVSRITRERVTAELLRGTAAAKKRAPAAAHLPRQAPQRESARKKASPKHKASTRAAPRPEPFDLGGSAAPAQAPGPAPQPKARSPPGPATHRRRKSLTDDPLEPRAAAAEAAAAGAVYGALTATRDADKQARPPRGTRVLRRRFDVGGPRARASQKKKIRRDRWSRETIARPKGRRPKRAETDMGEAGELRTPFAALWPRPPRSTRLAPQVRAALSEAAQWLRRSRVEEAQEADRRRRADEEATARAAADAAADAERALRDAQRDAASERGDSQSRAGRLPREPTRAAATSDRPDGESPPAGDARILRSLPRERRRGERGRPRAGSRPTSCGRPRASGSSRPRSSRTSASRTRSRSRPPRSRTRSAQRTGQEKGGFDVAST